MNRWGPWIGFPGSGQTRPLGETPIWTGLDPMADPILSHQLEDAPKVAGNSSFFLLKAGLRTNIYPNIMTKLEIKGDWNIIKGKLKQKWATLTDDDLKYAAGKQEEVVGRIQKRTGESREAVEKAIKESNDSCCK